MKSLLVKTKEKKKKAQITLQLKKKVVKIRTLLLIEEEVGDLFHFERAANIIQRLGRKEKN